MYIQVHIYTYHLHINLFIQPYQHINETITTGINQQGSNCTIISLFAEQVLEIQTVHDHILQFTKIFYLYKSIVEKIY